MNKKQTVIVLIALIVGYLMGFAHAYVRYDCQKMADAQGHKWIECDL